MSKFTCRLCGEVKGMDELTGKYSPITARGKCKPCHSKDVLSRHVEKKIAKKPGDYMYCDECDHSFSIYKHRGYWKHQDILHTCCPNCQSEDIHSYDEKNWRYHGEQN